MWVRGCGGGERAMVSLQVQPQSHAPSAFMYSRHLAATNGTRTGNSLSRRKIVPVSLTTIGNGAPNTPGRAGMCAPRRR